MPLAQPEEVTQREGTVTPRSGNPKQPAPVTEEVVNPRKEPIVLGIDVGSTR